MVRVVSVRASSLPDATVRTVLACIGQESTPLHGRQDATSSARVSSRVGAGSACCPHRTDTATRLTVTPHSARQAVSLVAVSGIKVTPAMWPTASDRSGVFSEDSTAGESDVNASSTRASVP